MADRFTTETLAARVRDLVERNGGRCIVGIDGRSGSGKSTLAGLLATELVESAADPTRVTGVTVIEGDQFYAGGSAATWDARTPAERADRVIDWRRQREVLTELVGAGEAEWRPFDWDSDDWDTDGAPLAETPVRARAAPVIIVEGAYSCRPELHDLLDLEVLLSVPEDRRRRQLLDREGDDHDAAWDERWASAEDHYFGSVMPPECFDVVVEASAARPESRFDGIEQPS